jgi:hypothetical protein
MIDEISANEATGSSGLAAKDLPASDIRGALILATDVTEMRDFGELSPTPWAFQLLTSLNLRANE